MRLKQVDVPGLTAVLAAALMVATGIVLTRLSGDRDAAAAARRSEHSTRARPAAVAPLSFIAAEPALPRREEPDQRPLERAAQPAPPAARPQPALAPAVPRSVAYSPMLPLPRRTTSKYPLPPFPAPDAIALTPGQAALIRPAPNVLWLSGVINGNPKVALLRHGDSRYFVKEGGTFESYRVVKIASNSVTIQRGGSKRTLRVGKP